MAPKQPKRSATPANAAAEDTTTAVEPTAPMKVEELESLGAAPRGTDQQADHEESGSAQSSESDDKANAASPSKSASSKSKRGTRASAGKSASSKKGAAQRDTDSAEDGASIEKAAEITEDFVKADEQQAAGTAPASNGSSALQRSHSVSKELSQLGVTSVADVEGDDSLGPRRSRRAPGTSPDPKTQEPKEEQPDDDKEQDQDQQIAATGGIHEAYPEGVVGAYDENTDLPDDGNDGGDEGVTRCVCGSSDENIGLMIQCETCKCWQHCVCMGMQVEADCPDVYYCEQCRPELHIPLLRSLGLLPKTNKKSGGRIQKYSAKELSDAKEAIFMLAEENARRAQEATASYGTRDRKSSANPRSEPRDKNELPKSPKRRSTMNSRDSAYNGWEPIPPGLLADGEAWDGVDTSPHEDKKGGRKRKRSGPDDEDDGSPGTPEAAEDVHDPSDLNKRRRVSNGVIAGPEEEDDAADRNVEEQEDATVDVAAPIREKSKKKKGNNQYTVRESSVAADSASKPRHPNQYTYRNKGRAVVAPNNGSKAGSGSTSNLTSHSHSPSPSPSKSRTESSRRGVAKESGSHAGTPAPGESTAHNRSNHSVPQLGLPEHLAHLSYLLPLANQRAQNGGKSLAGAAAASAALAKKQAAAGTSTPTGSAPAPSPLTPSPFRTVASIESSTKVRFPGRRMTLGEMRKRVRNIGEYVTRSQIEAVEREKRMRLLGIVAPSAEEVEDEGAATDARPDSTHSNGTVAAPDAGAAADNEGQAADSGSRSPLDRLPMSMRLMEELTRELINFQKRFGTGPGSTGGLTNTYSATTVK